MGTEDPRRERFEALLSEETYQAAWRFAYRLSHSREDAEDLLQEALAQAFARLGQLRDPQSFKPWLFAILRRCGLRSISRIRQRAGRESVFDAEAETASAPPGVDGLDADLLAALNSLPAPQREALLLHYLDGLGLAEIGQVLQCGERAAKQRLYRARGALRQLLTGGPAQADFSALL